MIELTLYSSPDCCLCDDAMALLNHLDIQERVQVNKDNIYQDKSLLIKYRTRIPVIKHAATNNELNWPFNLDELKVWLEECR